MKKFSTPFAARTTAAQILTGVDLSGRRIIVTGGASGLGTETVRALAGAGAQVTIATRNPGIAKPILEEFPKNTRVAAVDLADLESVRAFCARWDSPLDAIVANAGVMGLPGREANAQGWEMQLAINYLGHFALVAGLKPALQAAGRARVVLVVAGAQLLADFDFDDPQFERRPYHPLLAYAQAKTAETLLGVGISHKWAKDGITANITAPGVINTNLGRYMDLATLQALGSRDAEGNVMTPHYFKTPEQGAATAVLLAGSPLLEGVNGLYMEDNQEADTVDGGLDMLERVGGTEHMKGVARWAMDPVAADRLWEYTLPVIEATAQ